MILFQAHLSCLSAVLTTSLYLVTFSFLSIFFIYSFLSGVRAARGVGALLPAVGQRLVPAGCFLRVVGVVDAAVDGAAYLPARRQRRPQRVKPARLLGHMVHIVPTKKIRQEKTRRRRRRKRWWITFWRRELLPSRLAEGAGPRALREWTSASSRAAAVATKTWRERGGGGVSNNNAILRFLFSLFSLLSFFFLFFFFFFFVCYPGSELLRCRALACAEPAMLGAASSACWPGSSASSSSSTTAAAAAAATGSPESGGGGGADGVGSGTGGGDVACSRGWHSWGAVSAADGQPCLLHTGANSTLHLSIISHSPCRMSGRSARPAAAARRTGSAARARRSPGRTWRAPAGPRRTPRTALPRPAPCTHKLGRGGLECGLHNLNLLPS